MSYDLWKAAIAAARPHNPRLHAKCWNLDHESRVAVEMGRFCDALGAEHADALGRTADPVEAASAALDVVVERLRDCGCKWLGLLKVAKTDGIPATLVTHVSRRSLKRYCVEAKLDELRRVVLDTAFKVKPDGTLVSRFIWMTFAPGGGLGDDPTALKRRLGLDHFDEGDTVWRMEFAVDPTRLFVPTCFDAGLGAAWAPPPAGHVAPWGMTRDLTTGAAVLPELLAETADYISVRPVASLVSPPGATQIIESIVVDYMAGRTP